MKDNEHCYNVITIIIIRFNERNETETERCDFYCTMDIIEY